MAISNFFQQASRSAVLDVVDNILETAGAGSDGQVAAAAPVSAATANGPTAMDVEAPGPAAGATEGGEQVVQGQDGVTVTVVHLPPAQSYSQAVPSSATLAGAAGAVLLKAVLLPWLDELLLAVKLIVAAAWEGRGAAAAAIKVRGGVVLTGHSGPCAGAFVLASHLP